MLKNLSIQKKMNYFILMVTLSVFSVTVFVFLSMHHIESKYEDLHKNSMLGALHTLEIEKNLNYVSRTTRDIMLGGDYAHDISKLNDSIKRIEELFDTLEANMLSDEALNMVRDAKSSTMLFLNNSLKMMKSLNPDNILQDNMKIYQQYKNELTPFANTSRDSFKKFVKLKEDELATNSLELANNISFFKTLILFAGIFVGLTVFILATLLRKSITNGIQNL